MSGDHNMNQKPLVKTYFGGKPNYCTLHTFNRRLDYASKNIMSLIERLEV